MKIGYLGPRGTFTEQATRRYLQSDHFKATHETKETIKVNDQVNLEPYRSIPELLHDVEKGVLDRGVVPIENSIEGAVSITLDCLIHEVDLHIIGEVVLPIVHHLMAKPGVELQHIQAVISHPQGLAQCRKNLDKLLPEVSRLAATSTADAAQQAASDANYAAIGTALAAELYGLEILKSDMQDVEGNATRFVVASRSQAVRTGTDKTSVVFAFEKDRPGNLYRALGSFAEREINLTKLESRPAKQSLGQYIFLADLEGHGDEPIIQSALSEVRAACDFFKILGSYPRVNYHLPPTGK